MGWLVGFSVSLAIGTPAFAVTDLASLYINGPAPRFGELRGDARADAVFAALKTGKDLFCREEGGEQAPVFHLESLHERELASVAATLESLGSEKFEVIYGSAAKALLDPAIERQDLEALDDLVYRFPYTEAAFQAAYLLGLHFIEHQELQLATLYLLRAQAYEPSIDDSQTRLHLALRLMALARALGDTPLFAKAKHQFQAEIETNREITLAGKPVSTSLIANSESSWFDVHFKYRQRENKPGLLDFNSTLADWKWRALRISGLKTYNQITGENPEKDICFYFYLSDLFRRDIPVSHETLQAWGSLPLAALEQILRWKSDDASVVMRAMVTLSDLSWKVESYPASLADPLFLAFEKHRNVKQMAILMGRVLTRVDRGALTQLAERFSTRMEDRNFAIALAAAFSRGTSCSENPISVEQILTLSKLFAHTLDLHRDDEEIVALVFDAIANVSTLETFPRESVILAIRANLSHPKVRRELGILIKKLDWDILSEKIEMQSDTIEAAQGTKLLLQALVSATYRDHKVRDPKRILTLMRIHKADPEIVYSASVILGRDEMDLNEARADLLEVLLAHRDTSFLPHVAVLFRRIPKDEVPEMLQALEEVLVEKRAHRADVMAALLAIVYLNPPREKRPMPVLADLLTYYETDSEALIRICHASGNTQIDADRMIPKLLSLLEKFSSTAQPRRYTLMHLLTLSEPGQNELGAVIEALGNAGPAAAKAVPLIIKVMQSELGADFVLANTCVSALGKMGPAAKEALEEVEKLSRLQLPQDTKRIFLDVLDRISGLVE